MSSCCKGTRPLRAAYRDAALVLADGFPLIVASRLLGQPLPERVAGSELVPDLFDQLAERDALTRVYFTGSDAWCRDQGGASD